MKNIHLLATVCFMFLSFSTTLRAEEPKTSNQQTIPVYNPDINIITGEYIMRGSLNGHPFSIGDYMDTPRYFWNKETNYLTIETPYCPNARWEVVSPQDLSYSYNNGALTLTPYESENIGGMTPQIVLRFISGNIENEKPFTREFSTSIRFRDSENPY